jgi:phospholipid/cholesterol/gamma-HCH transport system ATP-binding protein
MTVYATTPSDIARPVPTPGGVLTPVVTVRGLKTVYGDHIIHEDLDLTVYPGEILALVGGSGAGKTTLMRQIIGLEHPAAGQIELLGLTLTDLPLGERRRLARRCGVLFQAGALFSALSVFENVALPLRELRTMPDDLIQDVVMCRLHMVGLTADDAHKRPADLSGGMIKRVGLARALSLDPQVLFLDEPTAGLDPQRSEEFVALVRNLHRQLHFTVIMITHDLDTLVELSTRVAVLADRRIIACGPLSQVIEVQNPFIDEFFLGIRGRRALGDLIPKDSAHGKP